MILRDYQQDCKKQLLADLKDGHNYLGAILPTGGGKTCIFIELIDDYLKLYPTKRVLILSTLGVLTSQTFNKFTQFYPTASVGILQGKRKPGAYHQIVIATVQSAKDEKKIIRWIQGNEREVGLIVGDEIHRLSDTMQFENAVKQHKAQVIGFSASFYRENQLITNMFDKISYQISMQELIDKKRLVPIELQQVVVDGVSFEERLTTFVRIYMDKEMGKKAIVFSRTVEEAQIARNVFASQGIRSAVVTGDIERKTRDRILTDFNQDKIQLLTTCDVLSQGFDSCNLEVVMDLYGTKSVSQFIQRAGRLSRPEDGDSVKPHHIKQNGRYYTSCTTPQAKSGLYKKMLTYANYEGSKEYEMDIFDDLDFMKLVEEEKTSEKYIWTEEACKIVKMLEEKGSIELAKKLRKKDFPPRFLRNLNMVGEAIKSDRFFEDDIKSLEICIKDVSKELEKWIIPNGKMMGKHVSELPYYYRRFVLDKAPNGDIGQMVYKWWVIGDRK